MKNGGGDIEMKRDSRNWFARILFGGVVAGGVVASAVLGASCVGEQQFYVSSNSTPSLSGQGVGGPQVCTNSGSTTNVVSTGTLDVTAAATAANGGPVGYVLFPVVQLDSSLSQIENATERNRVVINSAEVDIEGTDQFPLEEKSDDNPDGVPKELLRFSIPVTHIMNPGTTFLPILEVVPPQLVVGALQNFGELNRPVIVVNVRFVGELHAKVFKSATFSYSIQLCKGCGARNACGLPQDSLLFSTPGGSSDAGAADGV